MNENSQNACIAIWLKQGNTITPLEALQKFGCFRLGARIADLRKAGYNIETKMVEQNGKRFAQYRLNRNGFEETHIIDTLYVDVGEEKK